MIASTEGASTIEEIEQIAAALETTPEFISNMPFFFHQCLGLPAVTTLLTDSKNDQLDSFPELMYELISRHLLQTTADKKNRMKWIHKGVQLTQIQMHQIQDTRAELEDINPTKKVCASWDVYCYAILANLNMGMMYTDQTGMFPVRSYCNMKLIFVAYIYNIYTIIGLPLKIRTSESMIGAFKKVLKILDKQNCKPRVNVMDNKYSKAVEQYIISNNIDSELYPYQKSQFE